MRWLTIIGHSWRNAFKRQLAQLWDNCEGMLLRDDFSQNQPIFLHIIAKTNARWTTRDARSHRSYICRVFEPHMSACCALSAVWILVRRSDDFLKVLLYVKEDRRACGRLAYLWFRGRLSVKRCLSHSSGLLLPPLSVVCCCLPPPRFCLLATQIFFFPASLVHEWPMSCSSLFFLLFPHALRCPFFCFFSSLLPFFWPLSLWLYLL